MLCSICRGTVFQTEQQVKERSRGLLGMLKKCRGTPRQLERREVVGQVIFLFFGFYSKCDRNTLERSKLKNNIICSVFQKNLWLLCRGTNTEWQSVSVYILKVEFAIVVEHEICKAKMTKMLGLSTQLKQTCYLLTWERFQKEWVFAVK